MNKIATHDSTSGERPHWWDLISWIGIPFSRTQSKSISKQLDAGVRMFDLRVKKYFGKYHSGHGLYTTAHDFEYYCNILNNVGETVYATITYEGVLNNDEKIQEFEEYVNKIKDKYRNIVWGQVAIKYTKYHLKVDWKVLQQSQPGFPASISRFMKLNTDSWHFLIPIPWLWKKIYYNKPSFNDNIYTYVDFL